MVREIIKLDIDPSTLIGSPDAPNTATSLYVSGPDEITLNAELDFVSLGVAAGDRIFMWDSYSQSLILGIISAVHWDAGPPGVGSLLIPGPAGEHPTSFLTRHYYIVKASGNTVTLSFSGRNMPSKIKRVMIDGAYDFGEELENLNVVINGIPVDYLSALDMDCQNTNTVKITISGDAIYLYQVLMELTFGIYNY